MSEGDDNSVEQKGTEKKRRVDQEAGNLVRVDFTAARASLSSEELSQKNAEQTTQETEDKFSTFAQLITQGTVMVTLDARHAGTSVPTRFAKDPQLALNFSHRFGVADFAYDRAGVRCTLTFQGQPFFCVVPWTAVYGMRSHLDHKPWMWPASFPPEVLTALPPSAEEGLLRSLQERKNPTLENAPRHKAAKKNIPLTHAPDDEGRDPDPSTPAGKLRLIK